MANVTVIPATRNIHTGVRKDAVAKRKTAGYARVSTDSEEQLTSYEAQVDYYTNYIKSRPEWEFVNVYTDEGISATDTRHRSGFNQMVQDALDGKIDLIVTKSVSRFARNTVDSLTTVRKLKEKGVEVYFEKENIYTLDSKGELLITIMSSLAQEESRSISENVTWGKRKRFADGKVSLAYSSFLGYRKGEDGQMEVVPEEAETVRLIYRLFMQGQTPYAIAKYLTDRTSLRQRERRHGGTGRWRTSFPTRNTKAMPACRSATRWISFQRNARRMKGRCRNIMWRAAMTPSSSLQNGSSCRRRYSGGRTWGGAITAAARSRQS